jgi:dipeptidyl aminopeptidase/acylaminoacyl peptidase
MGKRPRHRGVSPEDLYRLKEAHQPEISPDGRWIAYVLQEMDPVRNAYLRSIWLQPVGGGPAKRFTAGGKDGDYHPRWSPDGTKLAFISHRAGKPQVFVIPVDGGEAVQLTRMPRGVSAFAWSPDGKRIAFLSRANARERAEEDRPGRGKPALEPELARLREEERKLQEKREFDPRVIDRMVFRHGTSFWDGRRTHIYVQELNRPRARRLTNGEHDFGPPRWGPDGTWIVSAANLTGDEDLTVRSDVIRISLEDGAITTLVGDGNGNGLAVVSPDGRWVGYICFHSERIWEQRTTLRVVPAAGGEVRDLTVAAELDVETFRFAPDSRAIYFTTPVKGCVELRRVELETGEITPVLGGRRMIGEFSLDRRGERLAFQFTDPTTPFDIATARSDGSSERRLTRLNRRLLSRRTLSIPEEAWIERPDGVRCQTWIMRPVGYEEGKRYPWVLEIHGGPHIMWGWSWWHEFQCLAARGFGVVYGNPRGSQGYGYAFKGAIHRRWGEEDLQDLLASVDLVVERGLADPERLMVTGGSFGGFMTSTIVAKDQRFKAAVTQRGVYNLTSLHGNSDALLLVDWEFESQPWEETLRLWESSPVAHVEKIHTPLLIIHAEQDYRAGIHTADELFVALKKLGRTVQYVRYPREGHELSRSGEPRHRVDRIERIIAWFERFDPGRQGTAGESGDPGRDR